MNEHSLKISPKYFSDVENGLKSFEVRKDDREPKYQIGDIIRLREFENRKYTGREIYKKITYVLRDTEYCKDGYCVLGFKQLGELETGIVRCKDCKHYYAQNNACTVDCISTHDIIRRKDDFCNYGRRV